MVEVLSRIQFAFTIAFHFIFVPLTVGLIIIVLIFEIQYFRKDDMRFKKLSNFFSEIFLINYAFGVVTGIAMTVQFGTNWGNYSIAMGEVFGSPLILEAILAFFLEATFNGLWLFRRHKMSKKMRLTTVSMIMIGTTLSALWVITANGFMQHPVGATWDGTKMILENFGALVLNPYTWYMMIHNHTSAIVLSGFVVLAISSWHMLKGKEEHKELFQIAAKYAAWVLLISSILMPLVGSSYVNFLNDVQPSKIAMIQGAVSGGLETAVRIAYSVMIILGTVFILISVYTIVFFKRYLKSPTLQKYYIYLVPLPYIAILTGWMVAEMGRQPWIIFEYMTVSEGISDVPVSQIWFSLIALTLFYAILFVMDYLLTIYRIKKGINVPIGGAANE